MPQQPPVPGSTDYDHPMRTDPKQELTPIIADTVSVRGALGHRASWLDPLFHHPRRCTQQGQGDCTDAKHFILTR